MELKELIERVRAATGPDRELDFDLLEMAGIGYYDYTRGHYEYQADKPGHLDLEKPYWADRPTNSIDAALALVERLCPDLVIKLTRLGDGSGMLQITEAWCADRGIEVVDDMSPLAPMPGAVAIILALLTALDQKEENE